METDHKIIYIYLTDETTTPYEIIKDLISSGKIIDILQLSLEFYEKLKKCLEEEEEFEDEPCSLKEILLQQMYYKFKFCSENHMTNRMVLETVGFDSQFAKDFSIHIEDDPLDMSLWDWIRHFVVSTLDRLLIKCLHWPTDGKPLSVVRHYGSLGDESPSERRKEFKRIDNSDLKGDFPDNLLLKLAEEIEEHEKSVRFWFHGTCQEFADDIITNGIDLDKGKEFGNYSHKDGFYLTDDLGLAIRAAHKKYCIPNKKNKYITKDMIVIIVFTYVEESKANPLKTRIQSAIDLTARSQEERLKKIVHYFSGGTKPRSETNVKEHGLGFDYKKKVQYIIGPYTYFREDKREAKDVKINWKLKQLCLRREEIKDDFELLLNPISLKLHKDEATTAYNLLEKKKGMFNPSAPIATSRTQAPPTQNRFQGLEASSDSSDNSGKYFEGTILYLTGIRLS